MHYNKLSCSSAECQFAIIECLNKGCGKVLSKIHLKMHDEVCPHKMIECHCGDTFKKRELPQHQSDACPLREVDCPFLSIGCMKVVQARDLQQHITEDVCSHLLLAVDRLGEYSVLTKDLANRVALLEKENKELKECLENQNKELKKKISLVEDKVSKTTKSLGTLEGTCKKEFKRLSNVK